MNGKVFAKSDFLLKCKICFLALPAMYIVIQDER